MNLGLVYLAMGKPQDAADYLRRATDMAPKSAEAWANYGVGLDSQGRYPEAATAYRKALELDSSSISALSNLTANLIAQKKPGDAILICQQLLLRTDSTLSRTRYGDALTLARQFDDAKQQYEIALKRDKRYYPAVTAEGFLFIARYEDGTELDESLKTAAVEMWKSSLQLNDDQPRVHAALKQWGN
jgi:tetratricopeptide (TPR) repeat protein